MVVFLCKTWQSDELNKHDCVTTPMQEKLFVFLRKWLFSEFKWRFSHVQAVVTFLNFIHSHVLPSTNLLRLLICGTH